MGNPEGEAREYEVLIELNNCSVTRTYRVTAASPEEAVRLVRTTPVTCESEEVHDGYETFYVDDEEIDL